MVDFYFSKNWWQFVLIAVGAYLVGSISFARLFSRMKNKDVSKMGSGNPGAMNMIRNFGPVLGFLTFFFDAIKAGGPAILVYHFYNNGFYGMKDAVTGLSNCTGWVFPPTGFPVGCFAACLCGACAVLGHVFPITSGFKGGKGISSGVGFLWLMLGMGNPWFWLIGLGVILTWPIVISLTKVGSLCTLTYLAGFGVWMIGALFSAFGIGNIWVSFCVACIFFVVALSWVAHRKNIRDLLAGEEHQTIIFKKKGLKK